MDKRANLRQHFQSEANKAELGKQHANRTAQLNDFENTVVDGFNALIRFIDGKTTKTEVVNQLKSISTPDVDKVVMAVSKLDRDVLANKLDLKPLVAQLNGIKREMSLVPKSLPKIPEQKDTVKVSNLDEIKLDTTAVEKAIKNLKLDPKIDVKAADVNVEAPDLKPIKDGLLEIVKVIKAQKYPEVPVTDLKTVEKELADQTKELKSHTKQLKTLIEQPKGGGGGGGGNGTPYIDSTGKPVNVEVEADGSIPVTAIIGTTNYTTRIAEDSGDSNLTYIGKAAIGSATSSAVWQIQKIDETTGMVITWAQTGLFTAKWDDRLSESYS